MENFYELLNDDEKSIQIEDFPQYHVTNFGRVYSTKTQRFIGNVNQKTGYVSVSLSEGRRNKTVYVHHLVMKYFGEPKPSPELEIDHRDKNPQNNKWDNLRWVTRQENLENRNEYKKDRKKRLTKKQMDIFNRYYIYHRDSLKDLSNEKIAKKFEEETQIGINPLTVRMNKDMWFIDNKTQELKRIPDELLD